MSVTLELSCGFCPERTKVEVDVPGWKVRYDEVYEERSFCPDHAPVEQFLDDQCPGCVEVFGDCDLSRSYEYPERRTITPAHLGTISVGRCPFRTNGTMMTSNVPGTPVSIESIDLSERSTAGVAMADAIAGYIERYPSPPWSDLAPWGTERVDDKGRTWECHGAWRMKP